MSAITAASDLSTVPTSSFNVSPTLPPAGPTSPSKARSVDPWTEEPIVQAGRRLGPLDDVGTDSEEQESAPDKARLLREIKADVEADAAALLAGSFHERVHEDDNDDDNGNDLDGGASTAEEEDDVTISSVVTTPLRSAGKSAPIAIEKPHGARMRSRFFGVSPSSDVKAPPLKGETV